MNPFRSSKHFTKSRAGELTLIFLFGLAPILWFRENRLLNTEDFVPPPSWEEYIRFWHVWNDQLGTGALHILDSGRFPTLFIASFLQQLGVSIVPAQMAQFVFWFMFPGFAMFYLMGGVYRGANAALARLAAVLFYMFNLWLISNWLGYKEPLLAAVAIMPILLGIWVRVFAADSGYRRAILISGLVSLLGSPIGNNVSEMLVSLIPVPLLFLTVLLQNSWRRQWPSVRRILTAAVALLGLLLFLHAFWIVPEVVGVRSAIAANTFPDFQQLSSEFLEGQSLNTSITNNIRFVSDWTWYQGLVDPYRSYAAAFTGSRLLEIMGWTIFGLVLLGAIFGKGRNKVYFILMLVMGIVAGAGLNSPLGTAYAWAFDNVPFFWIMRSPWFKFTFLTVIGYSVLLGLSAPILCRVFEKALRSVLRALPSRTVSRATFSVTLAVFMVVGPIYAYPHTLGLSFATADERTFMNPNHIEPPAYADQTAAWLDAQPGDFRVLTIPGDSPWLSDWGYTGFGSYLSWITLRPIVSKDRTQYLQISQGAPHASEDLIIQADQDLLDERSDAVPGLLARLGIRYIVHERDVRFDFYQGTGYRIGDSPENVERILRALPGIEPVESFGQWDIYEVEGAYPRFFTATNVVAVDALDAYIVARLGAVDGLDRAPFINTENVTPELRDRLVLQVQRADQASESSAAPIGYLDGTANLQILRPNQLDLFDVEIGVETDWGTVDEVVPGSLWRWVGIYNGEHYHIRSDSDATEFATLEFRAFSFKRERDLFAYLNGELLPVQTIAPDQPVQVRFPGIKFEPGTNVLSFYTPYASDERDGQMVSLAIEEAPSLSRARYEWISPVNGRFEIFIGIEPVSDEIWPDGLPRTLAVTKNDQPLELPEHGDRRGLYSTTLDLDAGARIEISQTGQEDYYIIALPANLTTDIPDAGTVDVLESTPTRHMLAVNCADRCLLVFNESFHPGWKATIDGRELSTHVELNGFANAYLINSPDAGEVKISFEPQRWFEWAFGASFATALASAGALVASSRHCRRQSA